MNVTQASALTKWRCHSQEKWFADLRIFTSQPNGKYLSVLFPVFILVLTQLTQLSRQANSCSTSKEIFHLFWNTAVDYLLLLSYSEVCESISHIHTFSSDIYFNIILLPYVTSFPNSPLKCFTDFLSVMCLSPRSEYSPNNPALV
jgi:hypothetical protein